MGTGCSNVKNIHKTVHCKLPDGKLVSVSANAHIRAVIVPRNLCSITFNAIMIDHKQLRPL